MDDFRRANNANWDDRVAIHLGPGGYKVEKFIADPDHLTSIVRTDSAYLGDVSGLRLLHAQCHIGTDTLSWAKLGAEVTGIDFSKPAIEAARDIAARAGLDASFVMCELYTAADTLDDQFDIVYTGAGALCWLPDIAKWADVMSALVRPGGRFYINEFHPYVWALEEREDDMLVVTGPYFEAKEPRRWDDPNTYLGQGQVTHTITYEWNHGLGEIVTALIKSGLHIELLDEHRTANINILPHMIKVADGLYALPELQREALPVMYSILASKPL